MKYFMKKENAKAYASKMRKKGYICSLYNKKGKGYTVYVKRK